MAGTVNKSDPMPAPASIHARRWQNCLLDNRASVALGKSLLISGHLTRVTGLVMEAVGLKMPVGGTCVVELPNSRVEAEVVGFSGEKLFLMPENDVQGLMPGARVVPQEPMRMPELGGNSRTLTRRAADRTRHLPVGNMLLGRVLDGAGRPLDQLGAGRGNCPPAKPPDQSS